MSEPSRSGPPYRTVKGPPYKPFAFRKCEFCGCNTNARVRACCDEGRLADQIKHKDSQ